MIRRVLAVALLAWACCGIHVSGQVAEPFEGGTVRLPGNAIDAHVSAALSERGITPANPSSDEVFLRRAYLDVIGTVPGAWEVQEFLKDQRADKRALLIDALLERDEFATYWTMKWCDVLRVKAEFPINLWPNAVQAYHRWIYEAIRDNRPYDEFARALLVSSGSNFRVPQVNFYRAVQGREPASIADAVALTFMGTRTAEWPAQMRSDMAAFFTRVRYKGTAEWKEEIVCLDPASAQPMECVLPDGFRVVIAAGQDPRQVFAEWLVTPGNAWFARCGANRVWAWLMGRGIIHAVDDAREDNPPSNAALLAYLEQELTASGYDMKHLYRLILNSRTYQQSSIPRTDHAEAEALFAYYLPRRLDAEVLIDALCRITGTRESYSSLIPEPFTFIPEEQRTIALADGSITSEFLEMFGRPARDTGLFSERSNAPTDAQRLHLLNSSHIQRKIDESATLQGIARIAGSSRRELVRLLYINILSRYPTQEESEVAMRYFADGQASFTQAAGDIAWALVNSKEFLYRH